MQDNKIQNARLKIEKLENWKTRKYAIENATKQTRKCEKENERQRNLKVFFKFRTWESLSVFIDCKTTNEATFCSNKLTCKITVRSKLPLFSLATWRDKTEENSQVRDVVTLMYRHLLTTYLKKNQWQLVGEISFSDWVSTLLTQRTWAVPDIVLYQYYLQIALFSCFDFIIRWWKFGGKNEERATKTTTICSSNSGTGNVNDQITVFK